MNLTRWFAAGATVLGVTGIAFALSFLSTAYDTPAGVEPAKVTDWMQAWGSIAAVAAGLLAALFTAALLLHEMRQAAAAQADAADARREAAEDRAQLTRQRDEEEKRLATFIVIDRPEVSVLDPDEIDDKVFVYLVALRVEIHNTGDVPVRDLVCEFLLRGDPEPLVRESHALVMADRDRPEPRGDVWAIGFSPRYLTTRTRFNPPRVTTPSILQRDMLQVRLTFTDANGRRWQRVDNGTPTRLDTKDAYVEPLRINHELLVHATDETKAFVNSLKQAHAETDAPNDLEPK